MITDNTKEKFEEWIQKQDYYFELRSNMSLSVYESVTEMIENFPMPLQWGVYLEFFDSVGIVIFIDDNLNSMRHSLTWEEKKEQCDFGYQVDYENYGSFKHKTRKEAQTEAIKKANDLFNQSNR